jgi:hypothetical protein
LTGREQDGLVPPWLGGRRTWSARGSTSADDLWNHPKNADLKAKRRDRDILCPGDVLFVPDASNVGADPLPLAAGTSNRYAATVPTVPVSLYLRDGEEVLKNEPYLVQGMVPDGADPVQGTTDGDGQVTLAVPVHVREITIELTGRGVRFRAQVGDMDCLTEDSGVRMRLENLGYYPQFLGHDDDALAAAVSAFQKASGIEATSVVDDATRDALGKAHRS